MNDTREQTHTAQVQMGDGSNAGKELAPTGRQALTVPQQREAARKNMLAQVESSKGEIQKFLKSFDIEYDFFLGGLRIFLMRQMQAQPEFFNKVTPASFMEALFRCAKDGLVPDGKEAAIGHFGGVATYLPMRSGFVKVLWRTGMIKDLNDQTVTRAEYEEGRFEYQEGDGGFVRHRPSLDRTDADEIVAAYCVVNLVTGGSIREVVGKADLVKIRKMSKSPARAQWGAQMDRKAALRRIMGKLPQEKAIAQLLNHDEDAYDHSLLDAPSRETVIPKAALFSDKAHVRAKPAIAAQEGPQERKGDAPPTQEPARDTEAARIVLLLSGADDLAALLDLTNEASDLELDADDHAWVQKAIEETRARLMPSVDEILEGDHVPDFEDAEFSDPASQEPSSEAGLMKGGAEEHPAPPDDFPGDRPPFVLRAVPSSVSGLKVYRYPRLWVGDLLGKLAATKEPALSAFWKINLPYILEAQANGYASDAQRILDIAAGKGLKVEGVQ